MAGFGGGAFIFDQIQTVFLNPENVKAVGQDRLNTTQDVGKEKYVKISARRQHPVLYKCTKVPLSFTYVHLLVLGGGILCRAASFLMEGRL